jgi:hypothetical protein
MQPVEESFLEPPHRHNPDGSEVISSPPLLVGCASTELRDCVKAIYISTSIVLASLKRLKMLHNEMAEVLSTKPESELSSDNKIDVEVYAFDAKMRFNSETRYFDEEVTPDWRCKAYILDGRLNNLDLAIEPMGFELLIVVNTWWPSLKALANTWFNESWELKVTDAWDDRDSFLQPSHNCASVVHENTDEFKNFTFIFTNLPQL